MNNTELSQEEINALLGGVANACDTEKLTEDEKDTLGEIGNICMGTAATTLYQIVDKRVHITTPKVNVLSRQELLTYFGDSVVATSVKYTSGVLGTNLLVLSEEDVKIITHLMMGDEGGLENEELTDLHLSAISEIMNQMIGSTSTSLSTILNAKIDISPPSATRVDIKKDWLKELNAEIDTVAIISFKMEIENVLDSRIIQIVPMPFAKTLIQMVKESSVEKPFSSTLEVESEVELGCLDKEDNGVETKQIEGIEERGLKMQNKKTSAPEFKSFDEREKTYPKENISLLMDVPLNVTVELGRTTKKIKEVLDFTPGSVVELSRLIGDPVDVFVNGKYIAKAEVVVIDENFGIRIVDIIKPENRI